MFSLWTLNVAIRFTYVFTCALHLFTTKLHLETEKAKIGVYALMMHSGGFKKSPLHKLSSEKLKYLNIFDTFTGDANLPIGLR